MAAFTRTLRALALIPLLAATASAQQANTRIMSGSLSLEINPASGSMMLAAVDPHATKRSIPIDGLTLDGKLQSGFERVNDARFRNDRVELAFEEIASGVIALTWTPLDGREHEFLFRIRSDDETRYYGTGERFNTLNQRGFILPMRVDDRYGNKGVGTHKPVLFFMSTQGFGIWVDTFAQATFDLSGSARFATDVEVTADRLRIVLIGGPSMATILERFTALTGRSPVPPPWAFGLWKSRDVHRNETEVYEDVEKLRRFDIPASVLVIDSPWETGYNDFEVNRHQFPDPEEMFRRVDELGYALCLWLTPFVNQRNVIDMDGITAVSSNFDDARRRGVLVEDASGRVALSDWWKGTGGLIDFTDPAAVEWWFGQLRKTKKWGARAFKADDGEGNFVPDAVFHDGAPASLMKNRYSKLYNETMQRYIEEKLGGDGVLIVRSGTTGVQRTPIAWAGDNRGDFSFDDGLPSVVVAGQNAAMSGISLWGSDIAGYAGRPTREVFIRWSQFGAFSPFMQVHMTSNLGPWDFDDETLAIFREFTRLRTRLFPYLYEAVHESARSGMPVIRPMALAFESDPDAHRHIHQYMYGPDLLVAPMIGPGTSRSVYLPAGIWFDWWTGRAFSGPRSIEVAAPLDRMPLFVREGAIIPMLPDDVDTLVDRHPRMSRDVVAMSDRPGREIEIWPGEHGSMKTWEGLSAELSGGSLVLFSETERPLTVRLHRRRLPLATIDGGEISHDPETDSTTIRFASFSGTREIPLSPRIRHRINDGWLYTEGDVEGAAGTDFDDSAWTPVTIPHTWNAEDAFDDVPDYRRGFGWYRRQLRLDPNLRGKRIHLYFEGANQVAEVFVNGGRAGSHVGGYSAFVFDVTELVRWDRENVIAVRVDNSHDETIPPLNADFTFYGGIYRDVWLLATDQLHVTVTDHASSGVFIDSPSVSAESAMMRVRGSVVNATERAAEIRIINRLIDPSGVELTSTSSVASVASGASVRFEHLTSEIERPLLWSPESPAVHTVRTEILKGDRLADVVENPFGFRWFAVDPKTGFTLNGKQMKLAGTNRHQDHAGLGNALPDELHWRDVEIIKSDGFNFLRLAHYPQDPAVLEAADALGLVVWEEIPVVNIIDMSDEFARNSERMLREMIRQHYNHPSVIFWGTQNEILLRKPNPIPDGYYETLLALMKRLDDLVREEDPSRATAMALSIEGIRNDRGIAAIPDVLGLNLYFGWYYKQLDSLGPFLDDLHEQRPELAIIVSEYGAGSDRRVHSTNPVAFDFSSEHAQRFHQIAFPQIEERPFILGSAVWNHFDFGSEFRNDTIPTINQKGLWFYDRTPKDIVWYYRAALLDEPILYIAREWNERAGSRPEDASQRVWVYSNLDEVELFVNGRSAGSREVVNRMAEWNVMLQDGVNELRAVGRRGSRVIEDETEIRYADRTSRFKGDQSGVVVAVNAGSPFSYVDEESIVWEADRGYEEGSWGFEGGKPAKTHHRIFGTPDDPLYQTSREGEALYPFDVSPGRYEVNLRFAERNEAQPGARVFDVVVNGTTVLSGFDPTAIAGARHPVERTFEIVAGEDRIVIELVPRTGEPAIAGILIRRVVGIE